MSQLIAITTPIRTFEGHENAIWAVAVSPDKRRMVTGSFDKTLRLWDLETGVVLNKMEGHNSYVWGLAVSRDGQIIASGDAKGEMIAWHGETGESLIQPINAHSKEIYSLDFSPDGTVLVTGSSDRTMKFWCTKTWEMQGEPIQCGSYVFCVRYSPSGELLAIATDENIQIYNSSTKERIASFKGHTSWNISLAWTPNGTRLLSGGDSEDPTIREWDTSTWQQIGQPWKGHSHYIYAIAIHPAGTLIASASNDKHVRLWQLSDQRTIAIFQHSSPQSCVTFSADGNHILSGGYDKKISKWAAPKNTNSKILAITSARDACIAGDLGTAEELLTQDIHTDANDYTLYAHRSFILARKCAWDLALDDAVKSISIQPSLICYISKGIALCGKGHIREARIAFDAASMFTNQDSGMNQFLLLIKAIALFSADQHEEAMLLIKELAAACPNADPLARRVVETYLRVQLGIKALDGSHYDEATDYFTAAITSGAFSSKYIHQIYEDLIMLFGWDLESLCFTAHQKRCQAFLSAGKPDEALEAHKYVMDAMDESAKANCLDWSNQFKEQCSVLVEQNDRILGAEIPGQEQDGYDTEPNFFDGMHQYSQVSQPRPQQHPWRLKRLRFRITRAPRPAPLTAPTIPPPVTTATTFRAHIRHLFTWSPHRARLPVVDVPFAQGKERNAAADEDRSKDPNIVPDDECLDTTQQDPNTQQQQQPAPVPGEDGGGRWCCCC